MNNISATNTCWITNSPANCQAAYGNTGKVVMHVSGTTNAHSELASQSNYGNVLCCNFALGNSQCIGTDKFLGLSSSTNAHSEIPDTNLPSYSTNNICYSNISYCATIPSTNNCAVGSNETAFILLSNTTNAHVESPDGTIYSQKICCSIIQGNINVNTITVTSPNGGEKWTVGSTHAITWTAASGISNVKIELSRDGGSTWETLFASVSAGSGSQNWVISGSTTNNALIRISDVANSATSGKSNAAFIISQPSGPCTISSVSWGASLRAVGKTVNLNVQTSNCDGQTVSFSVKRDTSIAGIHLLDPNAVTQPSNAVVSSNAATGTWTAEIVSNPSYYYFIAKIVGSNPTVQQTSSYNNELQVVNVDCTNVLTCADYLNSAICPGDVCGVANANAKSIGVDCSVSGTNCGCFWNETSSPPKCGINITYSTLCGNGAIDSGETCDGKNWGGITGCSSIGSFTGGTLSCNAPGTTNECQFNTSQCTGVGPGICGNNIINTGEACDGKNWGGITGCSSIGSFTGGTLSCNAPGTTNECQFNTSQCTTSPPVTYCGDGSVNQPNSAGGNEQCDPDTGTSVFLSNADTCVKLSQNLGMDSFNGGSLGCTGLCTFNTIQCTSPPGTKPFCGDGVANQNNETCDGNDLRGNTCATLGYQGGGTLGCNSQCQFNTSLCKPGTKNLPPTISLNATSTTVTTGGSTILNWSSTGADSCIGSWAGSVATSGIYAVQNLLSTTTYMITCTNSANGLSAYQLITITVTNVPGSPSVNFNVVPSTIANGQFVVFAWSSSNADSCTGSWTTGNIGINGIDSFSPSATANYTVTCTNSANGASASQKKTVTVTNIQLLPGITFNATPSTITLGGTATLTWSSSNADSCTGSWTTGNIGTTGTATISPTATTTYTITCTNSAGSSYQTKTVTITTTVGLPSVSISSVPSIITKNQASTLIWISSGADSCSATDPVGWTSKTATSGSDTVSPTTTTNYTIKCSNSKGSVSDKTTVSVSSIPIPPVVYLDSTSSTITLGGTATLTWSASGANSCTGSWTTGNIGTTGTATVSPAAPSTTYTITCTNSAGSASQIEIITVTNVPGVPTVTFNVNPSTIVSGDPTTLTWSATGTGTISCTGSWAIGDIGTSNSVVLNPTTTTNYTVTCTNSAGSASQKRTVTVASTAISICGDGNANEIYDTGRVKYCDPGNPDKGIVPSLPISFCSSLNSSIYQSGNQGGSLSCMSDCTYDISQCKFIPGVTPKCGDGVLNQVSEECDGNYFRGGVTCKSLGYSSGTLKCNSDCTIDKSSCVVPPTNPTKPGNNIGTCYYKQSSNGTCQGNQFLTVNLEATWVWSPSNPNHLDPKQLSASCVSKTEILQCPAQIPLPFFTVYNLVIALVIIAIIYTMNGMRRKKSRIKIV